MAKETIGVRDLKNRATQVVRSVREDAAEYIVTVGGQPVAVLRPYTPDDARSVRRETMLEELAALDELAQVVDREWSSPKTGLEILDEVRDESW